MDEDQLNQVFDTLFTAAGNQNNSGVPAHARELEKAAAPVTITREEYREMFDPSSEKFNPEAAMRQVVEKNYGNLLGDINQRSLAGLQVALKQQFPDFDKYEKDINQVLQGRPAASISQADLIGAYYMAKGARTTEAEIRVRNKPPTTAVPSIQKDADTIAVDSLTVAELDAARIMYRGSADPAKAFAEAKKKAEAWSGGPSRVPGDKA